MTRFLPSLRLRLLLLVLLALAPAIGLAVYSAAEQRQLAAAQAQESALRLARIAANGHDQLVERTHQLLSTLAQIPAVRDREPGTCSALLSSLLSQYPSYVDLAVLEPDGEVLCRTFTLTEAHRTLIHQFLDLARANPGFTIGEHRISAGSDRSVVGFGYPLLDRSGKLEAVVFAVLDLATANELAAQIGLPAGYTLTVTDRKGTILARYPSPELWVGRSVPEAPIVEIILNQRAEGTTEAIGEDGVPRLYAFTPLRSAPDRDIYVSVGIPTAIAFAEVNRILVRNLLALGVVGVVALGAAWVAADAFILREVRALLDVTGRLAAGDLSARTGLRQGVSELSRLARAFDAMVEALQKRDAQQHEQELACARLLHKTITAQEDERKRVARELHDELGQSLTLLMMDLELGRLSQSSDPPGAGAHLQQARTVAEETLNGLHRLIADLRPSLLDDLGLGPAIASYAEQRLKPLGIAFQLQDRLQRPLPPDMATALYRIAQEALSNIVKHAGAGHVTVTLGVDNGHLHLTVVDDGVGFQMPAGEGVRADGSGYGLLGMQERAHILGGEISLRTAPGQGAVVAVRVPLAGEDSDGEDTHPGR